MLEIEYIPLSKIKQYKKNAKLHPDWQIQQIVASIESFGFNDPIAIDDTNEIIEGHGRYLALKQLGIDTVPVIRLHGMSEQQKKAYILAHNKLTMNTDFDLDLLNEEMDSIFDFNMADFGFELPDMDFGKEEEEPAERNDPKMQMYENFNFYDYDPERVSGKYDMPTLQPCNVIPQKLIGFNYAKTATDHNCGIHFYLHDYQFERIWNTPQEYIPMLAKFQCVLTPSFSIYHDFPMAMKIYQVYRSRLLGQMLQDAGANVIPLVYWDDEKSFDWMFDGLPKNSTLSTYTFNAENPYYIDGLTEMLRQLKPKTLLLYGNTDNNKINIDFGKTKVIYFQNDVTQRMKKGKDNADQ